VISTSCSLLHVPYTVKSEAQLDEKYRVNFAFAEEKLSELTEIAQLADSPDYEQDSTYLANQAVIEHKSGDAFRYDDIRKKVSALTEADFVRSPSFEERRKLQKQALKLPLLPTTTIGSFPHTANVKKLRSRYNDGEINACEYTGAIRRKIAEVIEFQEKIGLDVLVHGEYERNDMVEYFGEKLAGFVFTKYTR
jgi:5-methyltetrahydropteroyltriglutamate--homocysteine methyltransferase